VGEPVFSASPSRFPRLGISQETKGGDGVART